MKEKPTHIHPAQMLLREAARNIIHPFVLRNESVDPYGGLKRFHDLLKQGKGGVVVEMHYSQIDPVWAIDSVTKRMGFRNIPIAQPIAADRALPGLVNFTKATGINIVKIVTPDVKDRANLKNPNNTLKVGDGQEEYLRKALEVVKNEKGIASVPPKATREDGLKQSGRDQAVASKLLLKLYMAGVKDFAIHFVAFEMDAIKKPEDYNKRRKYNLFRRHKAIHGHTYTLQEFIELAAAASPAKEGERPRKRDVRVLVESGEKVVYDQLSQIVPRSYLRADSLKM